MARPRARGGVGAIVAAAAAATVAGHELAYRLIYFQPHERDTALERTGHSYWPGAVRAAFLLAAVGVILQISRGAMAALSEPPRTRSLAARLVPLQLVLFTSMEMIERAVERESPLTFLSERTFWMGLLAQLVLSIVVAVLLRVARQAGQVLHALLSRATMPSRECSWTPQRVRSFSRAHHGSSRRTRAPPVCPAMTH